jgi:uncharacterized protein YkwD
MPVKFASAVFSILAAVALGPNGSQESPTPPAAPSPSRTIAEEIIRLTNLERQKVGAPLLQTDATIIRVAQGSAAVMAQRQKMDLSYANAGMRLLKGGFRWTCWGEILACGGDAQSVVRGMMNSPKHRQILLINDFTRIGVGVAYSLKGEPYFCLIFASPGQ